MFLSFYNVFAIIRSQKIKENHHATSRNVDKQLASWKGNCFPLNRNARQSKNCLRSFDWAFSFVGCFIRGKSLSLLLMLSTFGRLWMLVRPSTASNATMLAATMTTAAGDNSSTSMACPVIVLSGPSGGGKSTILERAMKSYPNCFAFSVSHTTRKPRNQEENGVHYWFTSREEMDRMIENNEFLEFATFGGNTYGTSKKAVEDITSHGKICVLDLELQGVLSIKASHLKAKYILIRPPSLEILEERLKKRQTETEETLLKRITHAREDLEAVKKDPHLFDHVIVNDDLEKAYNEFIFVLKNELAVVQKKH